MQQSKNAWYDPKYECGGKVIKLLSHFISPNSYTLPLKYWCVASIVYNNHCGMTIANWGQRCTEPFNFFGILVFVQLSCLLLSFIAALSSQEAVCYFISSATVRSNKFIVFSLLSVAWLCLEGKSIRLAPALLSILHPSAMARRDLTHTHTHVYKSRNVSDEVDFCTETSGGGDCLQSWITPCAEHWGLWLARRMFSSRQLFKTLHTNSHIFVLPLFVATLTSIVINTPLM